jgi:O-antigen/teichoic acid export membrane protein
MSLWKRNLFGMVSGAGSVVIKTGLNILLIPVLIAKLGLDAFGLYILLVAILEVSTLLDMGATGALVTLLGSDNLSDTTRRHYLHVGNMVFSILAGLFFGLGLLLLPQFSTVFHVTGNLQPIAQICFLLTLIEAIFMLYSCYPRAILLAHCSHQWTNVADTIYSTIASIGAVIALVSGYGLPVVLGIRLAGAAIRLLIMLTKTLHLEPAALWPKVPFCMTSFKKVSHLCGHAMMINFSVIISHKIDDIVIASFLPISAVGIYEIVFRFLGITIQICLKLHEGAYPLFSKMAAHQQFADARQLFLRMSSFLNFTATMLMMLIVLNYDVLFHIFSAGKIPIESTLPVLMIAVPCVLSGVLQMPASAWLFTWGYQNFLTSTSILASIANLVLSLILVRHFGIMGVALGTLIPQLIQHQFGLIRRTCRELKISLTQYIRDVHIAIIIPLFASILWVQCWRPIIDRCSIHLIPIGLIALSALVIGSLLWFRLSATTFEHDLLRRLFMVKLLQPIQGKFKQPINLDNA